MKNNSQKKTIQITVTEACNLDCVYCYEKNKDIRMMSVNKIKEIFKCSFAHDDNSNYIEFNFHGGEICLAFEVIKEACEWLWSKKWPKPYICFASTNGTLVHGEIKDWFFLNRNRFCLGLSLDGTSTMHNANRSNSYESIDIAFFQKTWPLQPIKMTISPFTISQISKGIQHINELGFLLSANLAYGEYWAPEMLNIYKNELAKLSQYYLRHPQKELPNLLSMSMKTIGLNILYPKNPVGTKWCGCGKYMICYGYDDQTYPCQMFMPSSNTKKNKIPDINDFSNEKLFEDPECFNCVIRYACPTCYGQNYIATGTLNKRPKDLCEFRKVEALAASYIQGKILISNKPYAFKKKLTAFEKKCIAIGIKEVQSKLMYI